MFKDAVPYVWIDFAAKSFGQFVGYFDEIVGVDNIHAYGKAGIAAEWIKRERPGRAVLIGDSDHDSEVAASVGIDCLLVSCGHMNAEKLAHLRTVFRDPLDAVKSISE